MKDLTNTAGVLQSACHYVASRCAKASSAGEGKEGAEPTFSGECPERRAAMSSAFRLLANLAYPDESRRRIMGFEGIIEAAARSVSSAARSILEIKTAELGSAACEARSVAAKEGETAAALLHRLGTVFGAEGEEEQLVAAGEALSAAVMAVSTAYSTTSISARDMANGVKEGGARQVIRYQSDPGLDGFALEALSALLVLSWSDVHSLEAAAAVDVVVTDSRLLKGMMSLMGQGVRPQSNPSTSESTGTLLKRVRCSTAVTSAAFGFLSSVSHRPTGRSALVSAGAVPLMIDIMLRRSSEAEGRHEISRTTRSELLGLLCILCASPTHRVVVREALVSAAKRRPGGEVGAEERTSEPSGSGTMDWARSGRVIEKQLALLRGDSVALSSECHFATVRLAALLGASSPEVVTAARPSLAASTTKGSQRNRISPPPEESRTFAKSRTAERQRSSTGSLPPEATAIPVPVSESDQRRRSADDSHDPGTVTAIPVSVEADQNGGHMPEVVVHAEVSPEFISC